MAKKNAQLLERFRSCCAWKLQQAAKPWEQRKTNLDKLREKYTYFPPLDRKFKSFYVAYITQQKLLAQFLTGQGTGK